MEIKTLSQLEDEYFGPIGTPERDQYEAELEDMRIGMRIREVRKKLEITQQELADRVNKKRSFISRVENDGSNLTLQTLRDIVERGFGGKIKIQLCL